MKGDTRDGTSIKWQDESGSPSEPVFVGRPGSTTEDDGRFFVFLCFFSFCVLFVFLWVYIFVCMFVCFNKCILLWKYSLKTIEFLDKIKMFTYADL